MSDLMEMAEALAALDRNSFDSDDSDLISDAAEMLKAVQNEMWRTNVLIQSYRVVIYDIGNRE